MNTAVNHVKSTAFGKKRYTSRGPTKHRKGLFLPKRTKKEPSGTKNDFINMIWQFTYDFWHWEHFNTEKGISSTENGCIKLK